MARFTAHCLQLSTEMVHDGAPPPEQFWLCDRMYEQMPQGHLATSCNPSHAALKARGLDTLVSSML